MAFIAEHSPDQDKGEWYVIGVDKDNDKPVEVRVRPIPPGVIRQIETTYGNPEKVASTYKTDSGEGQIHVRQRIYSDEDFTAMSVDKAKYAWTDTRNFIIRAKDDMMAKRYSGLLGGGVELKVGEDIVLDGRLSDGIKNHILDAAFVVSPGGNKADTKTIRGFIVEKSRELGSLARREEAALAKN